MKETKAVAVVKEKEVVEIGDNSPATMIRLAVQGKADLQQLKELLAIQKDWEANEARKIFTQSFASAQAKIASVIKTKVNPITHSKYADLGDIIVSASKVYTAEGFSVIFYEGDTTVSDSIRVCADILHKAGHKETYHYDVPLDGTGLKGNANMTKIHGKSSSVSYGRRYLMCMIWNIPTQDDNDGNNGEVIYITQEQGNKILDMVTSTGSDLGKFLSFMKAEKVEEILAKDYNKAIAAFEAKAKKAGAK
jgi:hypothetical protein